MRPSYAARKAAATTRESPSPLRLLDFVDYLGT
jgi:hypothetical protein